MAASGAEISPCKDKASEVFSDECCDVNLEGAALDHCLGLSNQWFT